MLDTIDVFIAKLQCSFVYDKRKNSYVKGSERGKQTKEFESFHTHVKAMCSFVDTVRPVNIYLAHAWTVSVGVFVCMATYMSQSMSVCVRVCSVSSCQTREVGGATGSNRAVCRDTPLLRDPVRSRARSFRHTETRRRGGAGVSKGDGLQQPMRRLLEPRLIYRSHRANQQRGVW